MHQSADSIVAAAIETGWGEILEDIEAGIVPTTVATFSELHDYIDANEWLNRADVPDAVYDAADHIQTELSHRLAARHAARR